MNTAETANNAAIKSTGNADQDIRTKDYNTADFTSSMTVKLTNDKQRVKRPIALYL